jgi:hypothetical protein
MTPKKATPLVLMIFTVMCALPAAVGAVPAAIAQEQTSSLEEDLASGIVSDVLDGGSDDENDNDNEENDSDAAGGDTNTQVTAPITDQDQTTADIAENRAANLDLEVVREQPTPTPPDEGGEEEPPEFVAFCFVSGLSVTQSLCFNTSEECEDAEEFLGDVTPNVSDCEGVETLPPNAINCVNARNEEGELVTVVC